MLLNNNFFAFSPSAHETEIFVSSFIFTRHYRRALRARYVVSFNCT